MSLVSVVSVIAFIPKVSVVLSNVDTNSDYDDSDYDYDSLDCDQDAQVR